MQITRYCGKQAAVPSINYLIHRQQTRSTDKLVQLSSYFRPSIYAHTYKLAAINGNDGWKQNWQNTYNTTQPNHN